MTPEKPKVTIKNGRKIYKFYGHSDDYEYLYTLFCFKVYRLIPDAEDYNRMLIFKDNDFSAPWWNGNSQIDGELEMSEYLLENQPEYEYVDMIIYMTDRFQKIEDGLK